MHFLTMFRMNCIPYSGQLGFTCQSRTKLGGMQEMASVHVIDTRRLILLRAASYGHTRYRHVAAF